MADAKTTPVVEIELQPSAAAAPSIADSVIPGIESPKVDPSPKKEKNSENDTPEKEKEKHEKKVRYAAKSLINLIIPISLTMLMVIGVQTFVKTAESQRFKSVIIPYAEPTNVSQVAINGLVFLAIVAVMTFVILGCVYCKAVCCLYFLITVTMFNVFFIICAIYSHRVFVAYNVPVDYLSISFVLYNFGAVGLISLFYKAPTIMNQSYTSIICALIAVVWIDMFHEYTAWAVLGILVLWDIFAVLTPCGPLNMLVKILTKQGGVKKIPPGLLYSTFVSFMADKPKQKKSASEPAEDKKSSEDSEDDDEEVGFHLGLGDFIFYSILIGKAADPTMKMSTGQIDWNAILACYVTILIGLIATVLILLVYERAIPALPLSLTLGLIFYFATTFVITPFCQHLSSHMIFM